MTRHYDALETRDAGEREKIHFERLPRQLAYARERTAYYAKALEGVDLASVTSREALAKLPVTRKSDLNALQGASLPFGGLNATPASKLARIFMSPGPIYDPEGRGPDFWRNARCLFAAGFRPGDLVLNCYSYHLTPAGSMFETGLHHLGCAVIPGGVGQTQLQAQAIGDLRPTGYVGTPSFLKLILEKCDEMGVDATCIARASLSGEAFLSAVLPGESPCGRTNLRIKGWMGRADQATKVRGQFVHPHQVAEVARRFGIVRSRLVVANEAGEDRMAFVAEHSGPPDPALAARIEEALRD